MWRWGHYITVVESFLEKRRQSVVLEGEHSHSVLVTSGVPQGSLLEPLMFLIFINDLPCYVKSRFWPFCWWHCHLPYNWIWERLPAVIRWSSRRLEKWESDWCMEFNPSKCNIVWVTRRHTPFKFQYKLHGKVLETVDTTKYLGIKLLHDLPWDACKWNYHQSKQDPEFFTLQPLHLFSQIQRTSIQSPLETDCWKQWQTTYVFRRCSNDNNYH